jgi:ligand-binding sensor domain-containing protein
MRHRSITLTLFSAIASLIAPPQTAAEALARPYQTMRQMYHQAWTTRDGAPSNIEEIAEGPDGFLWLATDDGLYRFDGVSFERYVTPGRLALPSNYVFRISVTRDGSLWLSYLNGGLSRIKDRDLKNFGARDGLLGGQINTVAEDLDGSFWIGGPQGLQILRGTTLTNVGRERGLAVGAVAAAAIDTEGNLWVSRAHDLLTLVRGRHTSQCRLPISLDRIS